MEPNALKLRGLSRARDGGSVVGVGTSLVHQIQSLELKMSQQAAAKGKRCNQRVSSKALGTQQSPGAGSGGGLGVPR